MAIFACDNHGTRYTGPQRTAYPALVNGTSTYRQKRRLCELCFGELVNWADEHLVDADSEGESTNGCFQCHAEETEWGLFVTFYDRAQPRHDYFGRACTAHAYNDAAIAFFGSTIGPDPTATK